VKKYFVLLLPFLIILFLLTSCRKKEIIDPYTDYPGYIRYRIEEHNIEFQYPGHWLILDKYSLSDEEVNAELDRINYDTSEYVKTMETTPAFFFDIDKKFDVLYSSGGITIESVEGLTQETFSSKEYLDRLKSELEKKGEEMTAFEWGRQPFSKDFNGKTAVIYALRYREKEMMFTNYYLFTVKDDIKYELFLKTTDERYKLNTIKQLEIVFQTFIFSD